MGDAQAQFTCEEVDGIGELIAENEKCIRSVGAVKQWKGSQAGTVGIEFRVED